jgi:glycosyltransferase involved in cell wall biosynthesis
VAREWIGGRLTRPALHKIPWGLEPRWFAEPPAPRARDGPTTIGFAGALTPHKGAHLLLEALHRLGWREARVRIAGGGDDAGYLARLRELAAGLSVEWVGRVAAGDMPAFMRSLDALVVPSRWTENLPFVVLEAAASGAAVIATDVPGIAEAVPDASRLFAMDCVEGLAACLQHWDASGRQPKSPSVSTAAEMCRRTLEVYRGASG